MKFRLLILTALLISAIQVSAHGMLDFSDLVKRVSDSVVNISIVYHRKSKHPRGDMPDSPFPEEHPWSELFKEFFDERNKAPRPFGTRSIGSGFIISNDGYVITNEHVVSEVKDDDEVIIKLSDRRELIAEIVGMDKNSDIALLKVDVKDLPVAELGNSELLQPGQGVLAIGSPFGFEHSVTAGIVSATQRSLPQANYVSFIQTDVAVNPGNSGGPLFDLQGKVVGINSHIYSGTGGFMGLSFAVPIELAIHVTEQLKEKGSVSMGWLGVYIQEVTRELAESLDIGKPHGALVSGLTSASPASKAGIKIGDLILKFNGKLIDKVSVLPPLVGRTKVGSKSVVSILRDGKVIALDVVIGELPMDEKEESSKQQKKEEGQHVETLGLTLVELEREELEKKELHEGALLVKKVEPNSSAHHAGVLQGDLLIMINNHRFKDFAAFADIVKDIPTGQFITLLVMRGEFTRFLALKISPQNGER